MLIELMHLKMEQELILTEFLGEFFYYLFRLHFNFQKNPEKFFDIEGSPLWIFSESIGVMRGLI